ncbi:MAG TPA: helix-turn-helix domain-containing protein [Actinopolymorphaceae bacterium]
MVEVADAVDSVPSELRAWQGRACAMPSAHRHDDLEVNLVAEAPLRYLFGGTPVDIGPGRIGVFWAAMPHRLIDCPDNWRARVCWLHVPLSIVLEWGLPDEAVARLLGGTPLLCSSGALRATPEHFRQWSADLSDGSTELRQIALLEIQAMVRRLVHLAIDQKPLAGARARAWAEGDEAVRHAAAMAEFAATRFRESITAGDVAAAVHLHPNYAMTVFRRVVGTTLGAYLTQCRVAEAQRLLITTTATTSDIAVAAGFGSQSSFYAAFGRACGQSPGAYRRSYRGAG